jgi:ribosomal protein S18 acetylase RimI-like enzyme
MELRKATPQDLEQIESLYRSCTDDLNGRGIFQWNRVYPNRQTFMDSIARKELFLFYDEESLVGAVMLNTEQADEWGAIPWRFTEKTPLVIHGLVVSPLTQGRGYGKKLLALCEDHARCQGFSAIRLDAFPENRAAVGLYEKQGYEKRGAVHFGYKPEGHREYHCYEKRL